MPRSVHRPLVLGGSYRLGREMLWSRKGELTCMLGERVGDSEQTCINWTIQLGMTFKGALIKDELLISNMHDA